VDGRLAFRRVWHREDMAHARIALTTLAAAGLLAVTAAGTSANTSHEDWPKIDGVLKINKNDGNDTLRGTHRSDELLGGHDSDTIWGRDAADVLWGDYKPSGQGTGQVDHLHGGAGADFIYASHGRNVIEAGADDDTIHAHFGRGSIDCGRGNDILFVSHRSRRGYHVSHCERVSYKTLGY
jgi:Ca2+-binding RTX toxin-like protein